MALAYAAQTNRLTRLSIGMPIIYGGDRVTYVSEALASAFEPGDRLIVVQETRIGNAVFLLRGPQFPPGTAITPCEANVSRTHEGA